MVPASVGYNGWHTAGQRVTAAGSSIVVHSPPDSTRSSSFICWRLSPLNVETAPIMSGNEERYPVSSSTLRGITGGKRYEIVPSEAAERTTTPSIAAAMSSYTADRP